jgi:hypothetical protein
MVCRLFTRAAEILNFGDFRLSIDQRSGTDPAGNGMRILYIQKVKRRSVFMVPGQTINYFFYRLKTTGKLEVDSKKLNSVALQTI